MARSTRWMMGGAATVAAVTLGMCLGPVVKEAAGQLTSAPRPGQDDEPKAGPLFREGGDIAARIEAAKPIAAAGRKRILVVWGSSIEPLSDRFYASLEAADNRQLRWLEYVEIWAETGSGGRADMNTKLAESLDAKPVLGGPPWVTVLDEQGAKVATIDSSSLYDKQRSRARPAYSAAKVYDFLKQHESPRVVAGEAVAAALAGGKQDGKGVLVYFTERTDRWSRRFEAMLSQDRVRDALSPHFVVLGVELLRAEKGWEELNRHVAAPENVPVFVTLKSDGTAAGTSQDPGQSNIGYPTNDPEFARMMGVLKSGWTALAKPGSSAPDWAAMEKVLREAAERTPLEAPGGH